MHTYQRKRHGILLPSLVHQLRFSVQYADKAHHVSRPIGKLPDTTPLVKVQQLVIDLVGEDAHIGISGRVSKGQNRQQLEVPDKHSQITSLPIHHHVRIYVLRGSNQCQRSDNPSIATQMINFVYHITGPSELKLQITIATDKTVLDLKQAIAEKSDVPADRQRLIYSGNVGDALKFAVICTKFLFLCKGES